MNSHSVDILSQICCGDTWEHPLQCSSVGSHVAAVSHDAMMTASFLFLFFCFEHGRTILTTLLAGMLPYHYVSSTYSHPLAQSEIPLRTLDDSRRILNWERSSSSMEKSTKFSTSLIIDPLHWALWRGYLLRIWYLKIFGHWKEPTNHFCHYSVRRLDGIVRGG